MLFKWLRDHANEVVVYDREHGFDYAPRSREDADNLTRSDDTGAR